MNSKAFLNDILQFVCYEISHLINIEGEEKINSFFKEKLWLNQKQWTLYAKNAILCKFLVSVEENDKNKI